MRLEKTILQFKNPSPYSVRKPYLYLFLLWRRFRSCRPYLPELRPISAMWVVYPERNRMRPNSDEWQSRPRAEHGDDVESDRMI